MKKIFLNSALNIFDDEDFKGMIDCNNPELKSISVNSKNTVKLLKGSVKEVKNYIREELKNKFVYLKIDTASRMGRSFLAVNVQYYSVLINKIIIRTLAVIELFASHTAQHIFHKINSVLSDYCINITKVISITSDNAANMLAVIKQLQDFQRIAASLEQLNRNSNENSSDVSSDESDKEDESNESDQVGGKLIYFLNHIFCLCAQEIR